MAQRLDFPFALSREDLPTLTAADIPNLGAGKITSGTFNQARLGGSLLPDSTTPVLSLNVSVTTSNQWVATGYTVPSGDNLYLAVVEDVSDVGSGYAITVPVWLPSWRVLDAATAGTNQGINSAMAWDGGHISLYIGRTASNEFLVTTGSDADDPMPFLLVKVW